MEVKSIIAQIIGDHPTADSLKEFIFLSRSIAFGFLRKKVCTGRLYLDFSTIPLEDLALDSIADLFQRDDNGTFIQLKVYFDGLSFEKLSNEEVLAYLRRLIFARVNQSILRMYHEADPTFGKILRNLKLAVQSIQSFTIVERLGEQCIVPTGCDSFEHLPPMEQNELEVSLRVIANGSENVPTLLARLSVVMREQVSNSRILPITLVVQVFRSLYDSPEESAVHTVPEDNFFVTDVKKIIDLACQCVQDENWPKYVGKNKVSVEIFEKYFDVIRLNLQQRIIDKDGEDFSFFDRLRTTLPDLDKR